jgi:hypothetical protein
MHRLAVRSNKLLILSHMARYGYSSEQRVRLITKLKAGQIWDIIKKYGPILFKLFIKYILPLLLVFEPPQLPMMSEYIDETEEELAAVQISGADHKDDTELE